MGLDTNIYWLTDRQSQCDFDFDLTQLGQSLSATWFSVEAGSSTCTVALRVKGDGKWTQYLGLYLGHPVPEGYKYGDLALQAGESRIWDSKLW
jgi:hypothetical protein